MPHSIEHCINAIVEEGIDRIKRSNLCESPGRAGGLPHYELGEAHTAWNTVSDKPWQFEVIWDDRDHVMESRYRLEGQKPVLVESRGRDPAIGFQGMVLAVLTLVIWKTTKWWRRRRAAANQPTID
jgi:hypothetical protein